MGGMDLTRLFSGIYVFILLLFIAVDAMILYVIGASLKIFIESLRYSAGRDENADIVRAKKLTGLLIAGAGAAVLILTLEFYPLLGRLSHYIPSEILVMTKRLFVACGALFIVYGFSRAFLYRVELYRNAIVICDGLKRRIISAEDMEYIHWNERKCTIISRAARPTTLSNSVFRDLHIKLRNYQKTLDIPDLKSGMYGN